MADGSSGAEGPRVAERTSAMRRFVLALVLLVAALGFTPGQAAVDPARALDLPALMLTPAQIQRWLGVPDSDTTFGAGRGFRDSAADLAILYADGAGVDPGPYTTMFERTGFLGSYRQSVGYANFASRTWTSAAHFRFDAYRDAAGAAEAHDYLAAHPEFTTTETLPIPAALAAADHVAFRSVATSSHTGWSLLIARGGVMAEVTLLHDGSGMPPDADNLADLGARLLDRIDAALAGAAPHLSDVAVDIVSGGAYVGEPFFAYYQRLDFLDVFYVGLSPELRGFHIDTLGPASHSYVHNTGLKRDPAAKDYDITLYVVITEYATEQLSTDQFFYLRDRHGADRVISEDARYGVPAFALTQGDIASVLIRHERLLIEVSVIPWGGATTSATVAASIAAAQLACITDPACERTLTLPADLLAS